MGWQSACDAAFAAFTLTWVLTRHIIFIGYCHSLAVHFGGDTHPYGTYSLTPHPQEGLDGIIMGQRISDNGGYAIWRPFTQPLFYPDSATVENNPRIKAVYFALMITLQGLLIIWFTLICRVIAKVLRGDGADDSRSDAEDHHEEEKEKDAAHSSQTK